MRLPCVSVQDRLAIAALSALVYESSLQVKYFPQSPVLRWAVIVALVSCRLADAAIPPNDTCGGAEVVPSGGPFPFLTAITDLKDATSPGDPGAPSCVFGGVSRGVWYQFTPQATALYTISCSGDTATTVLDTVMAIYTSVGGCAGPFAEVACSDDEGNLQSAISRTLNAGVTYYILVWVSGTSSPVDSRTTVQLRIAQPVIPPNDLCSGAEIIPANGPFPYLTSVADTTLAATTGDPPAPLCNNQSVRSVWYKFTPAVSATYELSLCTNTATTVYDPMIGIYTGTCGGAFTRVACNDNSSACGGNDADLNYRSVLTLSLTNGVDYFIVVWEAGNAAYIPGETLAQLRITRFLPPAVLTLPAHTLTSTGAVLTASVTPHDAPATAWFQFGLTTNYGTTTPPASLGAGAAAVDYQHAITALTPGALHHFRIVASNSLGLSLGTNQSFQWSAVSPNITAFTPTNANYSLRFTGQPQQWYGVLASTNLIHWSNLGPAVHLGGGLFEQLVPGTAPQNFFRVISP
jgi:hypothetical protein